MDSPTTVSPPPTTANATMATPTVESTPPPPTTTTTQQHVGTDNSVSDGTETAKNDDGPVYPHGIKLALIMGSSYLSMFLVALDRLIVTTAIPKITDDFKSVTNVGWYGSAYLLTNCAFQLFFGKLYSLYSVKVVFLVSILLFEIGSALCGAAPNSIAFIVGRAIAGSGSAGIFSGSISILVYSVPLHRRPFYQGLFGAVFGLANVISPLLGGAFTDSAATWRWCFYINLPLGAFSILCIYFLFHVGEQKTMGLSTKQKLTKLDSPGVVALLGGIISLLLALEWGGTQYAWNNGRIIALLVVAIILLICFAIIQVKWPESATVAPRVFTQRSILTASLSMFTTGAVMMTTFYYLPIWFQAIQGASAVQSGIRLLPLVIAQAIGSLAGGIAIQKLGYYTPVMLLSIVLMTVGSGLLTTLQPDTSEGKWIGYQIPFGAGLGITMQAPLLAAQTVLGKADVPIGTSLMFFTQLLGGSIFVSIGQNLFNNYFVKYLQGVPGIDSGTILKQGATSITNISEPAKSIVVSAYNDALRKVFITGLVMSALTFLAAAGLEWKSVKKPAPKTDVEAKSAETVENGTRAITSEKGNDA